MAMVELGDHQQISTPREEQGRLSKAAALRDVTRMTDLKHGLGYGDAVFQFQLIVVSTVLSIDTSTTAVPFDDVISGRVHFCHDRRQSPFPPPPPPPPPPPLRPVFLPNKVDTRIRVPA